MVTETETLVLFNTEPNVQFHRIGPMADSVSSGSVLCHANLMHILDNYWWLTTLYTEIKGTPIVEHSLWKSGV